MIINFKEWLKIKMLNKKIKVKLEKEVVGVLTEDEKNYYIILKTELTPFLKNKCKVILE